MNKTTAFESERAKAAVDTCGLMQMLSCGRETAVRIGTDAGARIQLGRRVLWNVRKIQTYLDEVAQ